ncbi:hypothetical protein GTY54_26350 [Streptomyces sp. SID625]|nr:hypothetical protein [Streptomyces sp. SID625]
MADPVFVTVEASPENAAPIVGLMEDAAAVAVAYFDQFPAGEEGTAFVTLTARTLYGTVPLGMWGFLRAADGTVTIAGTIEEDSDG